MGMWLWLLSCVTCACGAGALNFFWDAPTPFAKPVGRSLMEGQTHESFLDPETGRNLIVQHSVTQKQDAQAISLDDTEGIMGVACPGDGFLFVAFSDRQPAERFLRKLQPNVRIILTATRQPACGRVFLAEVQSRAEYQAVPQINAKVVYRIKYKDASYGSIFDFANITVSAALAEDVPRRSVQPQANIPQGRRLFFNFILKETWRAVKDLGKVALTAAARVAEAFGFDEFGPATLSKELFKFDKGDVLKEAVQATIRCTSCISSCEASSKLTAELTFHMSIKDGNPDVASVELKGTLANLLEIRGEESATFTQEQKLIQLPRIPIRFMLGAIPVYLDVDAGLYGGAEASVQADFGLTAAADVSLTLSAKYHGSSERVERGLDFNWDKLDATATFSGKTQAVLYLKPLVTLSAYKILQASFVLKVFYGAVGTIDGELLSGECTAGLEKYWGMDASLKVKLKGVASRSFTLYADQWPLEKVEEDCGPFIGLPASVLDDFLGDSDMDSNSNGSNGSNGSVGSSWQRTTDGCECAKTWTAEVSGETEELRCFDSCCPVGGRSICVKQDPSCGEGCFGACASRRLATCDEVQPFCNQNACDNEHPDCHSCGFCTTTTGTDATTDGTDGTDSATSTTGVSSGPSLSLSSARLGALWTGEISPVPGGKCASRPDAVLVLQLVEVDDWGDGNGLMVFMGATNVNLPDGPCTVTVAYEASLYGGIIQGGILKPKADEDFFEACDGFELPYGWRVDFAQEISGEDTDRCYSVRLRPSTPLRAARRLATCPINMSNFSDDDSAYLSSADFFSASTLPLLLLHGLFRLFARA
mmetsp:Transcript_33420/g.76989  ORF Transcript_33420/g.76989 Transcript_33420/m.76989 type:complete len:821 (-) Transcript_33420:227-2689(-)